MVKAVVVGLYVDKDCVFGSSNGGTGYGNYLHYPEILLRKMLEVYNIAFFSESQLPLEEADVVLCIDLTPDLYDRIKQLPSGIYKILQACESPLYAPFSHYYKVLGDPVWNAVLTWNRAFEGENIFHYDIPITGKTGSGLPEFLPERDLEFSECGVVIASGKGRDPRGFLPERQQFYKKMTAAGYIDLYGNGWKVEPEKNRFGKINDKIAVLKKYSYALVIENLWSDGYVTEKIGDCILAGLPVIYAGDFYYAQMRFPDTFVPLTDINVDCFIQAREKIRQNYTDFCQAVRGSYQNSDTWCDSYLLAMKNIFCKLGK